MDYEDLLEEKEGLYENVSESDDIPQVGKKEFETAKNFLSKISSKSNLSLYDHLGSVLRRVLRSRVEDAVDTLEDISLTLKSEGRTEDDDQGPSRDERLFQFVEEKKKFYELKPPASREAVRTATDEEVDDESNQKVEVEAEEEEEDDQSSTWDTNWDRMRKCGVGLPPDEAEELRLSLSRLAKQRHLVGLKFWGKVFTLSGAFYVAESDHSDDVTPDDFGAQKEDETDKNNEAEKEGSEMMDEKTSEEDKSKNDVTQKKKVPPEEAGTGINDRLYFVCTRVDQSWSCLPHLRPQHITDARRIKRFFTGDLKAEVGGGVAFSGLEAHYLRAQIARISACTIIAPEGYFETPDSDEDVRTQLSKDESYEVKSVSEMLKGGAESWVHARRAILEQGRCVPVEDEDEDEDDEDSEVGSELFEAKRESSVPLLRSLSEDKALGRLKPWNFKQSSKLSKALSILMVQSNIWPGAMTFYDGNHFDHLYIGFGYKFSVFHHGPMVALRLGKEFEPTSDLEEEEDSELSEPEPTEEADNEQSGSEVEEDNQNKDNDDEDEDDDEDENESESD